MCKLNLTDDLNSIVSVIEEAKSVADFTALRIEDIDIDTFDNNERNQLLSAVGAISRILLIADNNLMKLSDHYFGENDGKFASIICKDLIV